MTDTPKAAAVSRAVALYASVGPELTRYEVDVDAATLTRCESVTLPANIHYVWPHVSRRYLYAATSDSAPGVGGAAGSNHHVTAYQIDPGNGALSPHGASIPIPRRPIHMGSDIPSRHLLLAYSNPSGIEVYRINEDGTPGARVEQPEGIDPGIYAHQVRVTPDDKRAILVTRGHDAAKGKPEEPGALKIFDYADGVLSNEVSVAPGGGFGFGPRHLDFHPEKPWVYVSLERENKLDMFELRQDGLAALPSFRKETLADPAGNHGKQKGGTVHVHPNGRSVYVANRASETVEREGRKVFAGGENTLAVYAIDEATGEPSLIQIAETRGIHCRTFHIDPSGRLLVAAHIMGLPVAAGHSTRDVPACLSVFRVAEDGRLDFVRKYEVEIGSRTMFWMGMVPL